MAPHFITVYHRHGTIGGPEIDADWSGPQHRRRRRQAPSPGLGANVVRCKAGCGVFVETGYTWGRIGP